VQYLLEKNANPDICSTIKGSSPLTIAAATGHLRLAREFLAANANPMVRNTAGRNAMMIASKTVIA
jgi:ankyrin repeat protein